MSSSASLAHAADDVPVGHALIAAQIAGVGVQQRRAGATAPSQPTTIDPLSMNVQTSLLMPRLFPASTTL